MVRYFRFILKHPVLRYIKLMRTWSTYIKTFLRIGIIMMMIIIRRYVFKRFIQPWFLLIYISCTNLQNNVPLLLKSSIKEVPKSKFFSNYALITASSSLFYNNRIIFIRTRKASNPNNNIWVYVAALVGNAFGI